MNFDGLVAAITNAGELFTRNAMKSVNINLTLRNWLIGFYIQEYEQNGMDRAKYGSKLLPELAEKLQKAHLASSSQTRLKLYRQFYLAYPQIGPTLSDQFELKSEALPGIDKISPTVSGQSKLTMPAVELVTNLSFSKFVELMQIEDPLKRVFYELECVRGNWSVRELKRQIGSLYYERTGLSTNKKKLMNFVKTKAVPGEPIDIIRDPYVFEFLGLTPKDVFHENSLRDKLIDKLQNFMLEMGKGFCFEARNKRILIGDEYFFVDLVFYHRILKLSILVELKIGEFNHTNMGQLNTYLNYYKKHEKHSGDKDPIGILLCTKKNQALVEYALTDSANKLFVSKYELELPSKEVIGKFLEQELQKEEGVYTEKK